MVVPFLFTVLWAVNVPVVRVAAAAAPVKCAVPQTCALFENTSTGPALEALSSSGVGAYGATASGSYLDPGIEGESDAVTGTDAAAAFGLNFLTQGFAPTYGVLAYGVQNGLYGATEGNGHADIGSVAGVFGQDDGVTSEPDYNAGVLGSSSAGTGVLAEANGTPTFTGLGQEPIGLYAVAHRNDSVSSVGIVAESSDVPFAALNLQSAQNSTSVILGESSTPINVGSQVAGKTYTVSVDTYANMSLSGTVTASKGPELRTAGSSGKSRIAYGARTASPEIEDVGDGQLTNGRAYVTIDPELADSIDMRRPYHVFLTPEGNCKILYVSQKGPAGFAVREVQGGRSTLAFDYRIVGKPFDDDGARFAAVPRDPSSPIEGLSGRARALPPLAPEERLRRRLGTQGYAQALLAKRLSESAIR